MQREAKPRFDPSEHAKKQLAAKERAKELRDARQRGVVNEACTFTPKVNPRRAAEDNNDEQNHPPPPGSPPIRSKFNSASVQPPPSPPIKSKFQNQQPDPYPQEEEPTTPPKRRVSNLKKPNPPPKMQANDSSDSLDRLSGSYSKSRPPPKETYQPYEPEEPEHDALSNEFKSRTGRTIAREPKPKVANNAPSGGGGECLRNSSCRCRQCDPSSGASAPAPLARQRTMKPSPSLAADVSVVDQNSLSLLKSKMSRRKSRSAPTKPASMFVDDDKPRQVVHSAREPVARSEFVDKPPPRRQAPPPPANPPPPSVFDGVPDGESEVQDDGAHHECPDCHRKFNATAIVKHQKICKKVFQGPKKVFNMAAARLKGTEVEKMLQEKGIPLKAVTAAPPAAAAKAKSSETELKKQADWKKKSSAFRDAIKSSREYELAKKEGRALPPPKPAEIDPSLIQCQHCSRRFNEKAAERHIPHCKEKAERAALAAGPPKKNAVGGKAPAGKLPPPKPVAKPLAAKKK